MLLKKRDYKYIVHKRAGALFLAVLAMFGAAACSLVPASDANGELDVSESAAEDLVSPDEFRLALKLPCSSLNHYLGSSESVDEILTNCIDSLTEPDANGITVAAAADRWQCSADQKTWTFHIRNGIYWVDHNGNPTEYALTAQDFADGLRLMADPSTGLTADPLAGDLISGFSEYRETLQLIDSGGEYHLSREEVEASFDSAVGVKAIDKYTIEYTLTGALPYFPMLVSSNLMFLPVNLEFYKAMGNDYGIDKEHLIYCGPYYISHFERDKRVVLSKNHYYWDSDKVSVNSIEYRLLQEGVSEADMFVAGSLSYAALDAGDCMELSAGNWADYMLPSETSLSTDCLFFNFNSRNSEFAAFINNEDFRRALRCSLDMSAFAYMKDPLNPSSVLRNTLSAEGAIRDPSGRDYTDYPVLLPLKETDFFDPAQAREAMRSAVVRLCSSSGDIIDASAGTLDYLPAGKFQLDARLPVQAVFVCPDGNDDIIRAHMLEAFIEDSIGRDFIDIEIVCMADWTKGSVVDANNYDIFIGSLRTSCSDPAELLRGLVSSGSYNYGAFSLPEFDALVESAEAPNTFQGRVELLSLAEAMILDGIYIIPMGVSENSYYMSRSMPYTQSLALFGPTRFKGMITAESAVSRQELEQLREERSESR